MYVIENFLQKEILVAGAYFAHKLIKSDKSIAVDLDKFEAGETNILLVCGVAGSGKTTIGREYALANDAYYVGLDDIWWKISEQQGLDMSNMDARQLEKINQQVVDFALKQVGRKRAVIEGIQLFLASKSYSEQILAKYAVIFLGTSLIISGHREIIHSIKTKESLKIALKNAFIKNRQWNKVLRLHRIKRASVGDSNVTEVKFVYK